MKLVTNTKWSPDAWAVQFNITAKMPGTNVKTGKPAAVAFTKKLTWWFYPDNVATPWTVDCTWNAGPLKPLAPASD